MRFALRLLAFLTGGCVAAPGCGSSDQDAPAPERPPVQEIRWKGEDTGYRDRTLIQDEEEPKPF